MAYAILKHCCDNYCIVIGDWKFFRRKSSGAGTVKKVELGTSAGHSASISRSKDLVLCPLNNLTKYLSFFGILFTNLTPNFVKMFVVIITALS